MNTQQYIEYLIQQQLNNQDQNSPYNTLDRYKSGLDKVNRWGGNLQQGGEFLQGLDNQFANKLGTGMSNVGSAMQNGASKLTPKFTGFSQQASNPAIQGALTDALGSAGINAGLSAGANAGMSTIGNAVADTAGSSLAGIGSSIGAESAGATAGGIAGGASAGAGASAGGASGAMAGGPIGALVALGVMALQGTNRKRAKQGGEALMEQTNKMAKTIENDTTNQEFANKVIQQAQNNIAGNMTGGASPIEEPTQDAITQGSILNAQNMPTNTALGSVMTPNVNNALMTNNIYDAPVDNNVQTGTVTKNNTEQVKNSILDKFISGITDFSKGYQENRNTGFSPENLTQDRFAEQTTTNTPSQQLVDYQNSLRNQGIDENIINAVAQGKNSGNKDIDEWIKANPDALKPVSNTQTTYTGKEKGKMARFGESMGTLARALQNPTFQGLVAGGLGTALTGNPLYGLGLGYKFANKRAMSDIYQDALKKQGIDTSVGTFGNLDKGDFGALMTPHYKDAINNIALARLEEARNYHDLLMKDRMNRTETDKNYKAQKIAVDKQNANTRERKVTQGGGKGSGSKGGKATKPEQHPDWKNDLAGYIQRIDDPRYATKVGQLKAGFIRKYGVDPDKYIK